MARIERQITQAQSGERLDRALASLLPGLSAARIAKLIRQGAVAQDGRTLLRSNQKALLGQSYVLQLPLQEAALAELCVLYEDEHLLALAKPAGRLTHKTPRSKEESLADLAEARFGPLPLDAGPERPGIVHRLDRDTSGVIVLARHSESMAALRSAFRERSVQKHYLALVQGRSEQEQWTVDAALGPLDPANPSDRDRQRADPNGKQAITHFRALAQHGPYTWIACMPHTGRRHQIRVHLGLCGLFIAGDPLYRHPQPIKKGPKRLALHAESIALKHPATHLPWKAQCPLPSDLRPWCAAQIPSACDDL